MPILIVLHVDDFPHRRGNVRVTLAFRDSLTTPSSVWLSQCGPNTVLGMSELHRSGYSDRWLFRDAWLSQCCIGNVSVQSYMSVYGLES